MEENNLNTDLEEFLEAAELLHLLHIFKAKELDLQDLLSLERGKAGALEEIVGKESDYEKLRFALKMFDKSFSFGEHGTDSSNANGFNDKDCHTIPPSKVTETIQSFLTKNGLEAYIPGFEEAKIDLKAMIGMPESELKNYVPQGDHWSKLCRLRRKLWIAEFEKPLNLQPDENQDTFEFVQAPLEVADESLKKFLRDSGLEISIYLPLLEAHGIGLDELLNLPNENLREAVPKLGQWYNLCRAKDAFVEGRNRNNRPGPSRNFNFPPQRVYKEKSHENVRVADTSPVLTDDDDEDDPVESESDEDEEVAQVPGAEVRIRKTINILVVGETGSGKTTFINAIANYVTYGTMDEAMLGKILALISCSFTQADKFHKHHRVELVAEEDDANENNQIGQSATQTCKSYLFRFGEFEIRIMDTPGIGDVRGIDQDKINLENILSFISQFQELHGICIVLKPNESRLTVNFNYCLKELLCHLQKDAARNIMFVFTNTRGTCYLPGETYAILEKRLDEIRATPPYVNIPLGEENIFCFDNEAFRFLMIHKQGIQMNAGSERIFSKSWEISVKECKRLIGRLATITPHKVQDTISINKARQLIMELSKPIADIAQNVHVNLQVIEDKRLELLETDTEVIQLEQRLLYPVVRVEQNVFDKPRTVCTAAKCVEVRMVGTSAKIIHKQKCHDPCYIKNTPAESKGHEALLDCEAMDWETSLCHVCKCSVKDHMHIYYECVEVTEHREDPAVREMIEKTSDKKLLIAQAIRGLEVRSRALEAELRQITQATAKFAVFLKSNAIMPYDDSLKDYIKHLISNEKTKALIAGVSNKLVIEGMEKMLRAYEQEKRMLDEAVVPGDGAEQYDASILTPKSIMELEQELYAMEINGEKLKEFREGYHAARERAQFEHQPDRVYEPPPRRGRAGGNKIHWVSRLWRGVRDRFY